MSGQIWGKTRLHFKFSQSQLELVDTNFVGTIRISRRTNEEEERKRREKICIIKRENLINCNIVF